MQLVADSQRSETATLYAFNNAADKPEAYLWFCPNDENSFGNSYNKMILLDKQMRPIFLVSGRADLSDYAEMAASAWPWKLPEETIVFDTLERWKEAVIQYPGEPRALMERLVVSHPQQLTGPQEAQALQMWVDKSDNALAWKDSTAEREIVYWSSCAAQAWEHHNPLAGDILKSLVAPWDDSDDLTQIDRWRTLAQAMSRDNTKPAKQYSLPDIFDI